MDPRLFCVYGWIALNKQQKMKKRKFKNCNPKLKLFWRKTFHMSTPQNQELTGKIPNLKSIFQFAIFASTILCNLKEIKLKIFEQTLIDIRL